MVTLFGFVFGVDLYHAVGFHHALGFHHTGIRVVRAPRTKMLVPFAHVAIR